MQTTITFTDQDDAAVVASLLTRFAAALTGSAPAVPHAPQVEPEAPKAPKTRTKRADPVETYYALAAAAGAPTVPVATPKVEPEGVLVMEPEVTQPPAIDRPALEASVLAALTKAGSSWTKVNWPIGKPMRLGSFTLEELNEMLNKATAYNGAA